MCKNENCCVECLHRKQTKLITRERSNTDCLLLVLWGRRCWLQPKRHESVIPVGTNCKRNVAVLQQWSKKCKYCNGLYTLLIVLFIMSHRKLVGTGSWTHSVFLFWSSGRRSLTHTLTHTRSLTLSLIYSHIHSLRYSCSFTHSVRVTLTHSHTLAHTHSLTEVGR